MLYDQVCAVRDALRAEGHDKALHGLETLLKRTTHADDAELARQLRRLLQQDDALREAFGAHIHAVLTAQPEPQREHDLSFDDPLSDLDALPVTGGASWEDALFGDEGDTLYLADDEDDLLGALSDADPLPVQHGRGRGARIETDHLDPVLNFLDKADEDESEEDYILDAGHGRSEAMFDRVVLAATRALAAQCSTALVQMDREHAPEQVTLCCEEAYEGIPVQLTVVCQRQNERLLLGCSGVLGEVSGRMLPWHDSTLAFRGEPWEQGCRFMAESVVEYVGGLFNGILLRRRLQTMVEAFRQQLTAVLEDRGTVPIPGLGAKPEGRSSAVHEPQHEAREIKAPTAAELAIAQFDMTRLSRSLERFMEKNEAVSAAHSMPVEDEGLCIRMPEKGTTRAFFDRVMQAVQQQVQDFVQNDAVDRRKLPGERAELTYADDTGCTLRIVGSRLDEQLQLSISRPLKPQADRAAVQERLNVLNSRDPASHFYLEHRDNALQLMLGSVVYYNGGVLNLQACRCAVRDLFARWFRAANRFEDDDLLES